jgi:hypothetical protein
MTESNANSVGLDFRAQIGAWIMIYEEFDYGQAQGR